MKNGTPVFGLEIHLQLLTKSKAFCNCRNEHNAQPNSCVCPICLGLPGFMPQPNAEMFNAGIKLALSLSCDINLISRFDRKNYFYPDLPKGYQITQHFVPLAVNGKLPIDEKNYLNIAEIHLEEDSGRAIHDEPYVPEGKILIDYNRAGIPLAEIVTAPEKTNIEQIILALKNLQSLTRWLHISEAEMSNGSMRVDLNVSIEGQKGRSEIKNLNSFRDMKAAVNAYIKESSANPESSSILTRGWNSTSHKLTILRKKENLPDYRYIPDQDLKSVVFSQKDIEEIKEKTGIFPSSLKKEWKDLLGLDDDTVAELIKDKETAEYFSKIKSKDPKLAAKLIIQYHPHRLGIASSKIKDLMGQLEKGNINFTLAAEIIKRLIGNNSGVQEIMEKYQLKIIKDKNKLQDVLDVVIFEHGRQYQELCAGNRKMIKFFIGKVMKNTDRRADPEILKKLINKEIKECL